jgi:hypothetical protein
MPPEYEALTGFSYPLEYQAHQSGAVGSVPWVAPEKRAGSEEIMKRKGQKAETGQVENDDILPEYNFSGARPNKYSARYAAGSTVVVLEPDVAAVFPNAGDVNDALRALAGIIQKHRPRRARTGRRA